MLQALKVEIDGTDTLQPTRLTCNVGGCLVYTGAAGPRKRKCGFCNGGRLDLLQYAGATCGTFDWGR